MSPIAYTGSTSSALLLSAVVNTENLRRIGNGENHSSWDQPFRYVEILTKRLLSCGCLPSFPHCRPLKTPNSFGIIAIIGIRALLNLAWKSHGRLFVVDSGRLQRRGRYEPWGSKIRRFVYPNDSHEIGVFFFDLVSDRFPERKGTPRFSELMGSRYAIEALLGSRRMRAA